MRILRWLAVVSFILVALSLIYLVFGLGYRVSSVNEAETKKCRYDLDWVQRLKESRGIWLNSFLRKEKGATFETVLVQFATSRVLTSDKPGLRRCMAIGNGDKYRFAQGEFGRDRASAPSFGAALVSVPVQVHTTGSVERPITPFETFGLRWFEHDEDPTLYFTVVKLGVDNISSLLTRTTRLINNAQRFKRQALIFVHGYNTSFDAALYRTAQIAYDLRFDGPVFTYSWPASGAVEDYLYDANSATLAVPHLKAFLYSLSLVDEIDQINIIAHSLGTLPLMTVLKDMHEAGTDLSKIRQVILAAPDIDRDVFSALARAMTPNSKATTTIYASANDRALQVSYIANGSVPRAGQVYNGVPQVFRNIDSIDVSSAKMDFFSSNHSGYAESFLLLNDMAILMLSGTRPPDARTPILKAFTSESGPYWKYPN